jgi:hypothetical protein
MQQGHVHDSRTPELRVGTAATDERDDRTGVVMAVIAGHVWLCPAGGGREWEVPRAKIRPVPDPEPQAEEQK